MTDPRDGRRVALKKLPNVFQSLVSSKRVFRELKMLCFFKHENVSIKTLFFHFSTFKNIKKNRKKKLDQISFFIFITHAINSFLLITSVGRRKTSFSMHTSRFQHSRVEHMQFCVISRASDDGRVKTKLSNYVNYGNMKLLQSIRAHKTHKLQSSLSFELAETSQATTWRYRVEKCHANFTCVFTSFVVRLHFFHFYFGK